MTQAAAHWGGGREGAGGQDTQGVPLPFQGICRFEVTTGLPRAAEKTDGRGASEAPESLKVAARDPLGPGVPTSQGRVCCDGPRGHQRAGHGSGTGPWVWCWWRGRGGVAVCTPTRTRGRRPHGWRPSTSWGCNVLPGPRLWQLGPPCAGKDSRPAPCRTGPRWTGLGFGEQAGLAPCCCPVGLPQTPRRTDACLPRLGVNGPRPSPVCVPSSGSPADGRTHGPFLRPRRRPPSQRRRREPVAWSAPRVPQLPVPVVPVGGFWPLELRGSRQHRVLCFGGIVHSVIPPKKHKNANTLHDRNCKTNTGWQSRRHLVPAQLGTPVTGTPPRAWVWGLRIHLPNVHLGKPRTG